MKKIPICMLALLLLLLPSCADKTQDKGEYIDLTVMNSQMTYTQVYNIVNDPAEYLGKTLKIKGLFDYNHFDATDKDYYYCVIPDAAACCSHGIEFIWQGGHETSDYPDKNKEITIEGVYDTYTELGIVYYYVSANSIS